MPDTIAATVQAVFAVPAATDAPAGIDTRLDTARLDSMPVVTLAMPVDTVTAAAPAPSWTEGLPPVPRAVSPGNNSGFLLAAAVLLMVLIMNFRNLRRLLRSYWDELWHVRSGRDNVFDEHPAGDARVLLLLIVQAIATVGVLLSVAVCRLSPDAGIPFTTRAVAVVTALSAAWYLAQVVAYNLVGYTFTTPARHRDWLRGFNASQALMGVLLVVPAVLAVFYPTVTREALSVGLFVFILARLVFIFKGIRIFYDRIGSLLYFILYLCTLEVIPLIFVYKCARMLLSAYAA